MKSKPLLFLLPVAVVGTVVSYQHFSESGSALGMEPAETVQLDKPVRGVGEVAVPPTVMRVSEDVVVKGKAGAAGHKGSCGCANCSGGVKKVAVEDAPRLDMDKAFLGNVMKSVKGAAVQFRLPGGGDAAGVVDFSRMENGEVVSVQGRLSAPQAGFFFFQKQTMDGVAGKMVGAVRFDDSEVAYQVTGDVDGEPELVEVPLDDVVCNKYVFGEGVEGVVLAEEGPEDHTDYPSSPAYQNGVPIFESLPNSTAVIYLDFDGEEGPIAGWNVVDAAPAGISNAQIRATWEHVAEDYAPFNMNVTTDLQVYLAAPENSRVRCIISPSSPVSSGVAYLGSFNWTGDTPCWSGYRGGKVGHEVLSHEIGHTLGLRHDGSVTPAKAYYGGQGSGATGWSTIMGNSYYKTVTQWSKGEYNSANNLQDDLLIITENNNSVDYRDDDHGDSIGEASELEIFADHSVKNKGIIERGVDVDIFKFVTTAAGDVSLNLVGAEHSPNLDILAELLDSAGNVISSDNPDMALGANLSVTGLAAGTYYLRVSGVGRSDPATDGYSDYGSLGYFTVTGTVPNAVQPERFSIAENSANGSTVGGVTPRNDHGASAVSYAITSGDGAGFFSIDEATGGVTLTSALDFESFYKTFDNPVVTEFNVSVTNSQDSSLNETVRVVVTVTDVNEVGAFQGFSVSVDEYSSVGTVLRVVSADDPDVGDVATYAITGGNTGGAFAIDAATGVLSVASGLDYDVQSSYTLTVTATDTGGLSATGSVNITVTDSPDTDQDGFRDDFESARGSDPNDAGSVPNVLVVAHWGFDDLANTGGSIDLVGGVSSSFLGGADYGVASSGRSGQAGDHSLDLGSSANGAYAAIVDTAFLKQAASDDKMTISFWQKLDRTGVSMSSFWALSPTSLDAQRGMQAHSPWSNGAIYYDLGGAGAGRRISGTSSGTNWMQWTHLTFVKNGAVAEVWVDGVKRLSGSDMLALVTDFSKLSLGSNSDGGNSMAGELDDFAVFKTALTGAEIGQLSGGADPASLAGPNQAPQLADASFEVVENGGAGVVGTVTAIDPGDTVSYAITAGAGGLFVIDAATGEISTVGSLDFEVAVSYALTVQATDSSGVTGSATVTVNVTNVNETPVANDGSGALSEDAAVGSVVATVTSSDPDAGDSVSYTLTGGNAGGVFAIDSVSGVITTVGGLDYESVNTYTLSVTATDGGGLSDVASVSVSVTDSGADNDTDGDGYSDSFENAHGGDPNDPLVVPNVAAVAYWDFDNAGNPAVAADSILGNPASLISGAVFGADGSGRSGQSGDRAIDLGTTSSGQRLDVADVAFLQNAAGDNQLTISYWIKMSQASAYAQSSFWAVSPSSGDGQRGLQAHAPWENGNMYFDMGNSGTGHRVFGTPSATTWTDWHHVTLVRNGGVGEIWLDGVLVASQSNLVALATDYTRLVIGADRNGSNGVRGLMDDFTIYKIALDSDQITSLAGGGSPLLVEESDPNQAPVASDGIFDVAENSAGGVIGTVTAVDADTGDTLSFAITASSGSGLFTIDANTGEISSIGGFDHEGTSTYIISVEVTDAGGLTDTATVTVSVSDVNEAPIAVGDTGVVAENQSAGAVVATVTSSDVDAGDSVSYAITGGNAGGAFAINASTGAITTTNSLNFESVASYSLTVTAADSGNLSDSASVTVSVTDVNEAPVVAGGSGSVAENQAGGVVVATATSSDVDAGDSVSYEITGGNAGGAFAINSSSGVITTTGSLNYESVASYSLTVAATDSGGLSDSALVTVSVTNVNEAPTSDDVDAVVSEDAPSGTAFVTIGAVDPDGGDSVSYSIVGGNDGGLFVIDAATGAISLVGSVDYEDVASYVLVVRATDTGGLTTDILVNVDVEDVVEMPMLHWALNETSGSSASDSTGNGNAGTLMGGAAWTTGGKVGGAITLDGLNDSVRLALPETNWGAYTVALWAKNGAAGQNQYSSVFANHHPTGGQTFQIDMANGFQFRGGKRASFGAAPVGQWVHLVVRCDGTNTYLYYNGVLTQTLLNEKRDLFDTVTIGANRNGNRYFNGMVDELRVYDYALTDAEVQALHAGY